MAKVVNTQLVEIETIVLQASNTYRIQIVGDIFSISEDLQNIIQGNIKNQAYYIQSLLADKLDRCKGKKALRWMIILKRYKIHIKIYIKI